MFSSGDGSTTHVGLLAGAGMGHITPFLRLATLLLQRRRQCHVTLITADSTVSNAESQLISRFLSSFPQVSRLTFSPTPIDPSTASTNDPFWLQFESLRRSSAALTPLLSSITSPPLSALVIDVTLITPAANVAESLSIPAYVLFTSSLRMLSLFSHFPTIAASAGYPDSLRTGVRIPGLASPLPRASILPPLLDPTSLFTSIFLTDAPKLKTLLRGILVNTFQSLEPELFSAVQNGELASNLPNLFPVGPFPPCEFENPPPTEGTGTGTVKWLDAQPEGSVVYVGFGSRTTVGSEQMREIGEGLVRSGCRFLWVVKDKIVDREEGGEDGLEEILGREVLEKIKEKGLVVRHWVDQAEILRHGAVGGFVTQCGWNSTVEAAMYGVRVLAWPVHGDQGVNAGVVRACGFGMWVESWVTGGGSRTAAVKGDEIGESVREMMENDELRSVAAEIKKAASGDAAKRREEVIDKLIVEWKK